jgi:hypothetical protein
MKLPLARELGDDTDTPGFYETLEYEGGPEFEVVLY